ncbi:hypothetical protein HPP92_000966 [Vanilla planifolia]|uniref:Uncharacterized protein n=1 Tax=Vanilla planifolia TaxID=51239 RepID=A0A835S3T0_VANPL|nr:hypothetical protein HPP92_000966 [Vanilla planifolia]
MQVRKTSVSSAKLKISLKFSLSSCAGTLYEGFLQDPYLRTAFTKSQKRSMPISSRFCGFLNFTKMRLDVQSVTEEDTIAFVLRAFLIMRFMEGLEGLVVQKQMDMASLFHWVMACAYYSCTFGYSFYD